MAKKTKTAPTKKIEVKQLEFAAIAIIDADEIVGGAIEYDGKGSFRFQPLDYCYPKDGGKIEDVWSYLKDFSHDKWERNPAKAMKLAKHYVKATAEQEAK